MLKSKLILLFYFLLQIEALAQNIEFQKENFPGRAEDFKVALKAWNAGNKLFNRQEVDYWQCKNYFEEAYNFNPSNASLCFKLGVCNLKTGNNERSLSLLKNALILDANSNVLVFYYLGNSYQLKSEWDSAMVFYDKYLSALKIKESEYEYEITEKRKLECKNGLSMTKTQGIVKIQNLGEAINSKYEEYTPFVTADESKLFFTSRREGTTGNKIDEGSGQFFEDIYYSEKVNETWNRAANADPRVNTNAHDAICGIFPDGQTLIVFKGDVNFGDLFYIRYDNGVWGNLIDFGPNINTDDHESSACISSDGKKLYFVSDKPGGIGGRDIYVSSFDDSTKIWGPSKNLGPEINSIYDEEGVFLHPDNKTLFFASNGNLSMGGYDILKSEMLNGHWTTPVNLGIPINTPDDDVFVSVSGNGKNIYFSSTREEGFGGKDIYKAVPDSGALSPNMFLLTGEVVDESSNTPINATIDLIDLSTNEKINSYKNDKETGKFIIPLPGGKTYGTVVYADGYIFESENVDVNENADYEEIKQHPKLKKIESGSTAILNNIFFESGKSNLLVASANELDNIAAFLLLNSSINIEICGHTDNSGDSYSNILLSQQRGEEVYKELLKRNVPSNRISYKGLGETMPIASNATTEGRRKNRRIEFRILNP